MNQDSKLVSYPLPCIDDLFLLEPLERAKIFSELDLVGIYQQILTLIS